MQYSNEQIQEFLDGVYSGAITEYDLPDDLYEAIGKYLQQGMFKGFGGNFATATGSDYQLLTELHNNVWMFSAAKTYQQVLAIRDLLFNENGAVRSVGEFNKLGRAMFDNWNTNWGRSEYETAIGQAQMAVKWQEIQKHKDVLPVLVFDTTGIPCPECAPYEGYAALVDDPVWDWLMPLLHFNCHCTVKQEPKGYPLTGKVPDKTKIDPRFQMNPGKDKYIFSPNHPYFQVAGKDVEYAKKNFNLPIPIVPPEKGFPVQEARQKMQEIKELYTHGELAHVDIYTGSGYYPINQYWRKGELVDSPNIAYSKSADKKKWIDTVSKDIESFMDKSPKVEDTVYRGLTFASENEYEDFYNFLTKNSVIVDKAFMSTSYEEKVVDDFSHDILSAKLTVKAKNGVVVQDFSSHRVEKEVLLRRNSKFKVISVKKGLNKYGHSQIQAELEEIL